MNSKGNKIRDRTPKEPQKSESHISFFFAPYKLPHSIVYTKARICYLEALVRGCDSMFLKKLSLFLFTWFQYPNDGNAFDWSIFCVA